MSDVVVRYVMEGSGGLDNKLDGTSDRLQKVAKDAKKTDEAVGSMLERNRTRLNAWSEELKTGMEGTAKGLAVIGALGLATHYVLQENKEYAASLGKVGSELERIKAQIADRFGPSVGTAIENLTIGAVYLIEVLRGSYLILDAVGRGISDILEQEVMTIIQLAKDAKDIVVGILSGTFVNLDTIGENFVRNTDLLALVTAVAGDQIIAAQKGAEDAAREVWERFRKDVSNAKDPIKVPVTFVEPFAETMDDVVQAMLAEQARTAETHWSTITEDLSNLANQRRDDMMSFAEGLLSNAMGGGLSGVLTVAGGPLGALVDTVLKAIENLPQIAQGILMEVLNIYMNLDTWIEQFASGFLPHLIRLVPSIVSHFFTLAPRIISELITSLPEIASAIVDAFIDMIPVFIASFQTMFREFGRDLIAGLAPFGKEGRLGTNLGPNAEVKRILGVKLPHLDIGGTVTRSGPAWVDAGETYSGVSRGVGRRPSGAPVGRSGTTINIGAIMAPDPRETAAQLRYLSGAYGIRLKTSALVG